MKGPEWQLTHPALPTKRTAPRWAELEMAVALPCTQASNGPCPQERRRSYAPIALPAFATPCVTAVWFAVVMLAYSAPSPGMPWKGPSHVGGGLVRSGGRHPV